MNSEIWVWIEHDNGEVRESSLEMLGEARRLAKNTKGRVCGVVLGSGIAGIADEAAAYGADAVYVFDDERLAEYSSDLYLHAFSQLSVSWNPQVLLVASTPNGDGLAPQIATRFKGAFAGNAVTIAVQPDGSLKVNRSTCLGKAHGVLTFAPGRLVVATMKPGSVGLDCADRSRTAERVAMELGEALAPRTAVRGFVKADPAVVALDEAERVVAAGLGFHDERKLDLIRELAEVLGASVGGSKPVVDNEWLPRKRLVGQSSGKRVTARLFMGVGVSGTSYFVEGMKESRLIVAINTDKGAPLMKMADLAVCGDLTEVLPELTTQIRAWQEEAV